MSFRIRGLSSEPFIPLFALDEDALAARGIQRIVADEPGSAPCRINLEDAEPGERLLLLSHPHQPAATPFRQSGPIFVREGARQAYDQVDAIPSAFARRTLSARGYDREGMMIEGSRAGISPACSKPGWRGRRWTSSTSITHGAAATPVWRSEPRAGL